MVLSPRKKRKSRKRRSGRSWGIAIHLVVLAVLACASYVLWVDHSVRIAFEQRRWELPSRVYARPMELYAGRQISLGQVLAELNRLGYRRTAHVDGPGEYQAGQSMLLLHTRGFRFWDGAESPHAITLRFAVGGLRSIEALHSGDRPPALLRLEPVEIAKFYPAHHQDRVLVRVRDVPPKLIDALLAVEDRHFFEHHGIDPIGIARALWVDLSSGEIRQGGSTLTQQLVKNFYLGPQRTIWRKLNEMIMAISLDRHYGKPEILEAYLNEVFLGQDGQRAIRGFGMAAQFYFGRPLGELSVDQLALLAGLVRGPSYYDPRRAPLRCRNRRNLVLDAMVETGKLTPQVAARAKAAALGVTPRPLFRTSRYPAFMDLVRKQLAEDYRDEDLRTAGLQIFTTLDPQAQAAAESAAIHGTSRLEGGRNRPAGSLQTAIVVTATDTGEVLALVGGRDPTYAGYDHALDARRQIGSLVKPAVYLSALIQPQRFNVITPLDDAPVTWRNGGQTWTPGNYEGVSHGIVPMYVALAHSYNQATVRLGLQLGIPQVQQRLRDLGIQRTVPDYPSLLLGAIDLSPFEVAQMYQTIAAKGFRAPLRAIRDVLTQDGKRLTRYGLAVQPAVDPRADYLLTYLLTRVTQMGTAAALSGIFGSDTLLAGKTGTTNDLRDSWFAGFGSDRVAVVWVGRDDNASTGLTGATGAMRIWADVMRQLDPQPLVLDPPEGVDWRWVNAEGKLTDAQCAGAAPYPFITGTGPAQYQACHASAAGYDTLRRWGIH